MLQVSMTGSITWVQVPKDVIAPPDLPQPQEWRKEKPRASCQERSVMNVTVPPHPTPKRDIRAEKCTKNRSSPLISVKRNARAQPKPPTNIRFGMVWGAPNEWNLPQTSCRSETGAFASASHALCHGRCWRKNERTVGIVVKWWLRPVKVSIFRYSEFWKLRWSVVSWVLENVQWKDVSSVLRELVAKVLKATRITCASGQTERIKTRSVPRCRLIWSVHNFYIATT